MEAPAVTASSPISGGSSRAHRHSSSASTTADDEDGVSSKLVIDLDGYGDGRGSYSPSEYYCYSVCDATSAAEAMRVERASEEGGNTTAPATAAITATSCVVSVGNGHGATAASLSESIESVVSAAAAFASSPSIGSAGGGKVSSNGESEDGRAHRRSVIAGSNRPSSNATRVGGTGRSRASPSASRSAQSSSHDQPDCTQKTSPTPGGAAVRRCSPTAIVINAASSPSRPGESYSSDVGTTATASVSVRNGTVDGQNFRQQNNRNATSAVTLENTCTTNNGGTAEVLSPTSICVSLSPPIIATTISTSSSEASLTVAKSTSPVVSNKPRRSANSSSTKRSKTTNINNNTSSASVGISPSGAAKRSLGNGIMNADNMATESVVADPTTSPPISNDQQNDSNQQNASSILSQRQQSDSVPKTAMPRPMALFTPKDLFSGADDFPSSSQQSPAVDSINPEAGLTLKIKRKKMATRQTAASHEVITEKERKRENSDEASSSSSSSACASPAPMAAISRNSPLTITAGEKKRKSSSSSGSGLRAALANAGAPASPASSISSTSSTSTSSSSFYNLQQQQHSSATGVVSTPSSPPSANRASPSAAASIATVSPTVSPPVLSTGLNFRMAASDTISNSATVTGATPAAAVGEKGSTKMNSKTAKHNFQQETIGMGTPPRKKSKLHSSQPVLTFANASGNQQSSDHEQETKCSTPSISPTVFTPVSDVPKEKVEQHDAGTWVRTIGTATETECLGPCEPGTAVTLEGIVWQETAGGILVVNVTWRGKTYVGTLLDCTKYDWAPPRHCDSPHSENDSVTNGGNGNGSRTPAKSGNGSGNSNGRGRKGGGANRESKRQQQQQQQQGEPTPPASGTVSGGSSDQESSANSSEAAGSTSTAQNGGASGKDASTKAAISAILEPQSPIMFECPVGGCEKKFSAIVGVKYHQTSAHQQEGSMFTGKHIHGLCQQVTKSEQETKESATSPVAVPEEPTRSLLEEAVAATTKLSPEERASLESLFRVAEQTRQHQGQSESRKLSNRAGSPAYSDISDDESAPSTLPEHPSTTTTTAVLHSGHAVEKPTAIVEPQPLSSTIVALSADSPSSASPSQQPLAPMGASSSALHESPRGQKRSHSGISKSLKDSKQSKERHPASAMVEPNTARVTPPVAASSTISVSPSTSRSPDTCPSSKSQPSMLVKPEPGSPRPRFQEFVAPAPPSLPVLQQQLAPTPSQSTPVIPRVSTPSSIPSPASMVQPGMTFSQPSANVPPVPASPAHHHLNMINQLNHPAFMFNPFNGSGPIFPGGGMPPGMMQPTMGMDPTMAAATAAALMSAGHPAASMYAPPGSMAAAALAAAGFQMGLGGPPGSHASVGYGFGQAPPSLAVSMAPGVLPPSFVGPTPSSAQPILHQPNSPATSLQQQPLHKIHELAEHAKRSTSAEVSVLAPSVMVPPSASVSNSVVSGGSGSRKVSTPNSGSTPTVTSDSVTGSANHGKHRQSASTPKLPSAGVTATSSHHGGQGNSKPGAGDSDRQQSRQSSTAPTSTTNATSDSKTVGSLPSVSPPVQRHLHTHHHTHTYPTLLAPTIDPSYAAIMASQQAAAAAGVVGGFPSFGTPSKS